MWLNNKKKEKCSTNNRHSNKLIWRIACDRKNTNTFISVNKVFENFPRTEIDAERAIFFAFFLVFFADDFSISCLFCDFFLYFRHFSFACVFTLHLLPSSVYTCRKFVIILIYCNSMERNNFHKQQNGYTTALNSCYCVAAKIIEGKIKLQKQKLNETVAKRNMEITRLFLHLSMELNQFLCVRVCTRAAVLLFFSDHICWLFNSFFRLPQSFCSICNSVFVVA